jgi:hypothetical protein
MMKKLWSKWWIVLILSTTNLYLINLFAEYIISREVALEIQIVSTLGVLVFAVFNIKLIFNLIYNFLKKEKND